MEDQSPGTRLRFFLLAREGLSRLGRGTGDPTPVAELSRQPREMIQTALVSRLDTAASTLYSRTCACSPLPLPCRSVRAPRRLDCVRGGHRSSSSSSPLRALQRISGVLLLPWMECASASTGVSVSVCAVHLRMHGRGQRVYGPARVYLCLQPTIYAISSKTSVALS